MKDFKDAMDKVDADIAAEAAASVNEQTIERARDIYTAVAKTSTATLPAGPYAHLQRILALALAQAATGKGKERHAASPVGQRDWHDQPILSIARMVGPGGHAYQVAKKAQESVTMAGNKNFSGAKAEALGAIVYAAGLYKLYEEMEASQ